MCAGGIQLLRRGLPRGPYEAGGDCATLFCGLMFVAGVLAVIRSFRY